MDTPLEFLYRPATSSNEKRIMVLLHGLGSSDDDLYSLHPYIDSSIEFYCLQGPEPYYGGYKWFSLEIDQSGVSYELSEARESMKLVAETIKAFQENHGVGAEATILGGFSQGSILSLALMLQDANLAQFGWLMSGASIPDLVPEVPAVYSSPPSILVQHGIHDPVLPLSLGEKSVGVLRDSIGADVIIKRYGMAHSISEQSIRDAVTWLQGGSLSSDD